MEGKEDISRLAELHRQALQRNEEARTRLQRLNEYGQEVNARLSRQSGSSKEQALNSHLENVRLSRQHSRLQILSHYSKRVEAVARDDGIYNSLPSLLPRKQDQNNGDATADRIQIKLSEMLNHVKTLTTDVELALVKARLNLKREQILLRTLQHSAGDQSNHNSQIDTTSRLRALEVTRDELQRWVEESLAQCEQTDGEKPHGPVASNVTPEAQNTRIHVAYQTYLEQRKRLIDIVNQLEQSTGDTTFEKDRPTIRTTPSAERQSRHLQPAPQLRQYRRSSSHAGDAIGIALAEIQNTSVLRYRHEKLLGSYLSHLTEQTQAQDVMLLRNLSRLSHESHLLPSHPYATIQYDKLNPALTRQQGEIDQLLSAWAQASTAAAQIGDRSIGIQTAEAETSLQQANADIQELVAVESLRQKFMQTESKSRA